MNNKFVLNTHITRRRLPQEFVPTAKKQFIEEVANSEIIYLGHAESEPKYYKSSKGNFIGQPDYILKNSDGEIFIVEEKFKEINKIPGVFHQDHKEQLTAYIHGLDILKAHHGYLIYWYYAKEDNYKSTRIVESFDVLRIDKYQTLDNSLKETYRQLISLSGAVFDFFPEKINHNKCINCAVKNFCAHKTGRFTSLSIPYDLSYYSLIPFDNKWNLIYDYGNNPNSPY